MSNKSFLIAVGAFVVVMSISIGAAWVGYRNTIEEENEIPEDSANTREVLVYFVDEKNPASQTSCGVTRGVSRTIEVIPRVADATLRELFEGPTAEEREQGLRSTFEPALGGIGAVALGDYFIGVTIEGGVATVNFQRAALKYLNSAACMQESVKKPIEDTLMQFPSVSRVEYSIDGEVFDEWDA